MSEAFENGDRQSPVTSETTLSAMLDGEASAFEVRRVLDQVEERPGLADQWARYSLGRSVLEGEPFVRAPDDFSARVMEAVHRDAVPLHTSGVHGQEAASGPGRRWIEPVGRLAVAASVAVAVFLGMELSLQGEVTRPGMMADSGQGEGQAVNVQIDADAQQRLNDYIQSVAISGDNTRSGVDESIAELENLRQTPQLRPVADRELVVPEPSRD
ncbi:MAG: sigma-E factor negative regulatory protein [Pseudohongiellaceae bacterium]